MKYVQFTKMVPVIAAFAAIAITTESPAASRRSDLKPNKWQLEHPAIPMEIVWP